MKSFINSLKSLQFENSAYLLPIDKSLNNKPRNVIGFVYSEVEPEKKENPKLIAFSKKAFSLIQVDLDPSLEENVQILCGNLIPPSAKPLAHCYCGYQFGNWAGQLGDGRAISIGDVNGYDLQLKGSGLTPYSRFADGKAVLRSSIREYLCSEAMNALGIPTTRAASIVVTDDLAIRDMYYNGNPKQEKCSVVLRMSPTFLRFGSFEIEKDLNEKGSLVPQLWKFCQKYYQTNDPFREIVQKTAKLVAQWQCYGFCHGVLNTDNMSIIGLTIDYGPFAFIDYFNKEHICNHSDDQGRYSYENQPGVCYWNLQKLCEALDSVLDKNLTLQIVEEEYYKEYYKNYYFIMLQRLGLIGIEEPKECSKQQKMLVDQFFKTLDFSCTNYSKVFNILKKFKFSEEWDLNQYDQLLIEELTQLSAPKNIYLFKKKPRLNIEQLIKFQNLYDTQPHIALMMGLDTDFIKDQLQKVKDYENIQQMSEEQRTNQIRMMWSDWISFYKMQPLINNRIDIMNSRNPLYTLTNSVLQEVISEAEAGNYQLLHKVQECIENPFIQYSQEMDQLFNKICDQDICVSCSS